MEGQEDPETGTESKRGRNVGTMLANADGVKSAWNNFMGEFLKSSFDSNELDPVLSHLKLLNQDTENNQNNKNDEEDEDQMSQNMNGFDNDLSQLEKKVFGNHLLSKAIFSHLSVGRLLPCRLVNTAWNKTVIEILEKKLTLKFSSDTSRFYLGPMSRWSSTSNWLNLDMFTELFKSSNFPCTRYEFYKGNLGNDDAQRFFSGFGSRITYLKFDSSRKRMSSCDCEDGYDSDDLSDEEGYRGNVYQAPGFSLRPTTLATVGNILTTKAVNIKELVLKIENGYDFNLKDDIKLPHLTSLTFACDQESGRKPLLCLLKGAENLQTIDIGDKYPANILLELPPSCQKSLVKIETFRNFDWDSSVKFPVFENVQHISLTAIKDQGSFLPSGSSLSTNFPKLNSLTLDFSCGAEASTSWRAFFPTAEKISTVQKLTIKGALLCPPDTEKLLELFPSLKKIIVFEFQSFFTFALTIWKFHKCLHLLQLGENFCRPWSHFPVLNPDSSIAIDGPLACEELLAASSSDLEFIWQNFVQNNKDPFLTRLRGYWHCRTLKPSDHQVCSRTRYRLLDSSTLTLTKLVHSRGMTWEDALVKQHEKGKVPEDGFYMETHEIKGIRGEKKDKVVKTVKTVQLLIKLRDVVPARGTMYTSYQPTIGESTTFKPPNSNIQKVDVKEAKRLWEREYSFSGPPKLQCEHLYRQGKCTAGGRGSQCKSGVRDLTYFVLSGSVLKETQTVLDVLCPSPNVNLAHVNFYTSLMRVQDDLEPVMGIQISDHLVENLKQALSALAVNVEEQSY